MIFYRLISILLAPFLIIYLYLRIKKGKEDQNRIGERLGSPSMKRRPQGDIVWLHAVSVGETNSVLVLLDEILKSSPDVKILFTTTTLTSAAILSEKIKVYQGRVIHQFLPVDSYFIVKRFINFWNPKTAIFVESEIWPNLIYEAHKQGAKTVLVNARMSESSFGKWQLAKKLGFKIFNSFDLIFVQSPSDQVRLKELSNKEILFYGNLKSEAANLSYDEESFDEITKQVSDNGKIRKIWLAASTHKGEEDIIIETHKKLKKEFPDLLTIIVPRHPNRADEIKALMLDVSFAQRSVGDKIMTKTDIYLADTLGELGLFYRLSKIAFIGGSLKEIGGHNPFEAIKLGCLIMSGRHVFNFKEIYAALEDKMAYFLVESSSDIVVMLSKLFVNDNLCNETIRNANKVIEGDGKIAENIVRKIFYTKT